MRKRSVIDALIPGIRQGILRLTYGQPERRWYLSELAAELGTSPSSLQRDLESLSASAILRKETEGRRTYYRADQDSAIFEELRSIVDKTMGVAREIRLALPRHGERIKIAFIYGSVARREDRATSDIDVFIIGNIGLAALAPIATKLERRLGRAVNPTVMTAAELRKRKAAGDHFITEVLRAKKEFLIGDQRELETIAG